MAYHVSLVNTDKKDISSKLIMNKEKFREFLFKEFKMKEEINKNGTLEFYYDKDNPSFTILPNLCKYHYDYRRICGEHHSTFLTRSFWDL